MFNSTLEGFIEQIAKGKKILNRDVNCLTDQNLVESFLTFDIDCMSNGTLCKTMCAIFNLVNKVMRYWGYT